METLASRLDALQETLLVLYETDSSKLEDQITHWKNVRLENVMLYKARESGLTRIGHQVVPVLGVAKAKACKAIEIQLALQTLQNSPYACEPWTLRDTSQEIWEAPPKQCWKKRGYTVEVRFDGDEEKAMCYTAWRDIYVQNFADDTWVKHAGKVDHAGLYFVHEGIRVDYVKFAKEAVTYGNQGTWSVYVGGQLIDECESVSSTQDTKQVPIAGSAAPGLHSGEPLLHAPETTAGAQRLGPPASPPRTPTKRQRVRVGSEQSADPSERLWQKQRRVDSGQRPVVCHADSSNQHGNCSDCNVAPVTHLRGDPNKLKCLRYRLGKHKSILFNKVSSTWHWATGADTDKGTFVTVWHSDREQQGRFLATVSIPKDIEVLQGHMSMFP
ncbi:E2 [Colobus guereza papillomavirus 1]|uniref:Regulatory protein E2 n=1 Tax=Colobus guereza papillomavirus 1 TaxID=2759889 RepID=F8QPQ3_9PAPI|nr:E2 [Colobus guereza papillomavirus 1]